MSEKILLCISYGRYALKCGNAIHLARPPNSEQVGKLTLFPPQSEALHPRPTEVSGFKGHEQELNTHIHMTSVGHIKRKKTVTRTCLLSKDHMVNSMERHDA